MRQKPIESYTSPSKRNVVLIGAGIGSLAIGFYLVATGYHVTFVEKENDFRSINFNQKETKTLSVKSLGRHLSATETLPFNANRKSRLPMDYVNDDGWLSKPARAISSAEKEWQNAFYKTAVENPQFFEYATKLSIDLNRQGMQKWMELFKEYPKLAEGLNIRTPLYRLFVELPSVSEEKRYRANEEIRQQQENNSNCRILSKEESDELFPGVQNVKEVIEVEGASVNITRLVHNMISHLEEHDAEFMWNTHAKTILRNNKGWVSGIQTEDKNGVQRLLKADDYVICTGNGGNDLLKGLSSHNKVQGLTGLWATLPNIHGIRNSFKIHASEQFGVSNITVSEDGRHLYISGMHGYIGLDHDLDMEKDSGAALRNRFCQYVQELFPQEHAQAITNGTFEVTKGCYRPSTADGLPIIDSVRAENGQLIVNIGHNCGGFQLALILGEVIEQTLQGKPDNLLSQLNSTRYSLNQHVHRDTIRSNL